MSIGNAMNEYSPDRNPYKRAENIRKIREEVEVAPRADLANSPFLVPEHKEKVEELIKSLDKIRWELDKVLPVIEKMHMSIAYKNAFTPIIMLFLERAYLDCAMGKNYLGKELAKIGLEEKDKEDGSD